MKIALSVLLFGAAISAIPVHAGPSGPSARAAARLKKYPTSRWLAHYLPDDRYKIAGGVWKYVSTDLDTYYHRPDSGLMMQQPAGRVIGFSSAAEAEEAGYTPGPGIQVERQRMQDLEAKRATMRARSVPGSNPELLKLLAVLTELQNISGQMQNDKGRDLQVLKQRLERMVVLIDNIPAAPRDARTKTNLKNGLRGIVKAVELKMQGKDDEAMRQATVALTMLQSNDRPTMNRRRRR